MGRLFGLRTCSDRSVELRPWHRLFLPVRSSTCPGGKVETGRCVCSIILTSLMRYFPAKSGAQVIPFRANQVGSGAPDFDAPR